MKPTPRILREFFPAAPRLKRTLLCAGFAATLALLVAHAAVYWFLCDDAFISFRYARNLAEGHGLVFNPGQERVEGYTNFLWVVLLGAGAFLGVPPESAAHPISMVATVLLWALVARYVLRSPPAAGREWIALAPLLLLAATRSVAVWSTSGLETRLFEVLAIGALLLLVDEIGSIMGGDAERRLFSPLLLALATLTRPDGLVIAAAALGIAAVYLDIRGRLRLRAAMTAAALYVVPVAAHLVFRRLYYGEWLPNTYYVKVGGQTWWEMGGSYLGASILEYAAYLWIPFLAAAVVHHWARNTEFIPLLFGGVILIQALYVASVGGDHFEYRPLDLCFPLAFLLIYDGARHLARSRPAAVATAAGLGVVLAGLLALPVRSHVQFPATYTPAFPGGATDTAAGARFLDPDGDPIYRLPGLRRVGAAHRDLLRTMSTRFVGLRQEEHRLFLSTVVSEGIRLGDLVRGGVIRPDAHLAISCVGAIPYYSDLRVFDRLGLTDRDVARSPVRGPRVMAHDKVATLEDAVRKDVDFWAYDGVHSLRLGTDPLFLRDLKKAGQPGTAVYLAPAGDGWYFLGDLPRGAGAAAGKFPGLRFTRADDTAATRPVFEEAIRHHGGRARSDPHDVEAVRAYADVLLAAGDNDAAIREYGRLAASGDARAAFSAGIAWEENGDPQQALAAFATAARLRPDFAEAYYRLGIALLDLGRAGDAALALTRASRLQPYDAATRYMLALAHLERGDRDAALEQYRVLRRLDKDLAADLRSSFGG